MRTSLKGAASSVAAYALAAQITGVVGALVQLKLLSMALPPSAFGMLSLALAAGAMVVGVFVTPWMQAILRLRVSAVASESLVAEAAQPAPLVVAAALVLGVLFARNFASAQEAFAAVAGFLLLCLGEFLRGRVLTLANRENNMRRFAYAMFVDALLRAVAAGILIIPQRVEAAEALLAIGAASLTAALIVATPVERRFALLLGGRPAWRGGHARPGKDLVDFALPIVPIAVVTWLYSLGDRYIVAYFLGLASTGTYAAYCGVVSRPFATLGQLLELIFRQRLYAAAIDADRADWARVARRWLLTAGGLSVLGFGTFAIVGEAVIRLLLGERYLGSYVFLLVLAGAHCLYVVAYTTVRFAYSFGATGWALILECVCAGIALTGAIALIPLAGLTGAALATLLAYTALILLAAGLVTRLRAQYFATST